LSFSLGAAGAWAQSGSNTDLLQVSVQYPRVDAVAGETFAFRADVKNLDTTAHNYDLIIKGPEGWEFVITPYLDFYKQISTMRIEPGVYQTIDIAAVPPAAGAPTGEYKIDLNVVSGTMQVTVEMTAVVKSSYVMSITPVVEVSSDAVIKTSAVIGRTNIYSIKVGNYGTSEITGVSFTVDKSEGWSVEPSPVTIPAIKAGEHKTVDLNITPPAGSKAGDRYITVRAIGKETAASLEIRVEARPPFIWGWVALAVVAVGIAGLIFWRRACRKSKPA